MAQSMKDDDTVWEIVIGVKHKFTAFPHLLWLLLKE